MNSFRNDVEILYFNDSTIQRFNFQFDTLFLCYYKCLEIVVIESIVSLIYVQNLIKYTSFDVHSSQSGGSSKLVEYWRQQKWNANQEAIDLTELNIIFRVQPSLFSDTFFSLQWSFFYWLKERWIEFLNTLIYSLLLL